jgi:LmbE family N-acetylglucosaminyl deacetylase
MKITVKFKPQKPEPPVKVPRIAKLMALAIHFDQLIREGKVRDQAEIAELGHVSRARVTQLMNLLNLAPEIQEELLVDVRSITERELRTIAAKASWSKQQRMWFALSRGTAGN